MIKLIINEKEKIIDVKESLSETNAGFVYRLKVFEDLYIDYHIVKNEFGKESFCDYDYNLYVEYQSCEKLVYERGSVEECVFAAEQDIIEIFSRI